MIKIRMLIETFDLTPYVVPTLRSAACARLDLFTRPRPIFLLIVKCTTHAKC